MTALGVRDAEYWRRLPEQETRRLEKLLGCRIVETKRADPDSQFRLRSCRRCEGTDGVYLRISTGGGLMWRVRCMACGNMGRPWDILHDAQMDWNQIMAVMPRRKKQ